MDGLSAACAGPARASSRLTIRPFAKPANYSTMDHGSPRATRQSSRCSAPIYTVKQVLSDPLETNRGRGLYTSFTNLLDLCAIAIPAARRENGLPFGISLIAPPLHDEWLCAFGASSATALS